MEIHMLDWSRSIEIFTQEGYGRYHLRNKTDIPYETYIISKNNMITIYCMISKRRYLFKIESTDGLSCRLVISLMY